MLGTDRHHLTGGMTDDFLTKYGANDVLGQKARVAEAARLIKAMDNHEAEVQHREQAATEVDDRIQQIIVQQQIDRDYLISFGVLARHRGELRQVLHEILEHKQLTPREAVRLANSRAQFPDQRSNGVSESEPFASVD